MRNPTSPVYIVILCALGIVVASYARAAEPVELRARAAGLRKEVSALASQGRVDEAAKLEREADELETTADKMHTKMQKAGKTKPVDKSAKTLTGKVVDAGQQQGARKKVVDVTDEKAGPANAAQRVKHLRTAAQHLKAAGLSELSSNVWREADLLEEGTKPAKVVAKKGPEDGAGDGSGIAAEVKSLRIEVQRLKAELAEMRKRSQ